MALVTQENIDFVKQTKQDFDAVASAATEISTIMEKRVYARIRSDEILNQGTDWDEIVALYQLDYDAALVNLKTLAEALPRWNLI